MNKPSRRASMPTRSIGTPFSNVGEANKLPSKPPQVFDSQEAVVAAAYVEYADAIQQRWRK
jgi:hypothetical protein